MSNHKWLCHYVIIQLLWRWSCIYESHSQSILYYDSVSGISPTAAGTVFISVTIKANINCNSIICYCHSISVFSVTLSSQLQRNLEHLILLSHYWSHSEFSLLSLFDFFAKVYMTWNITLFALKVGSYDNEIPGF